MTWQLYQAPHLRNAAHNKLMKFMKPFQEARRGVQAFADALLVVPKTLAENSGFDVMDTIKNARSLREDCALRFELRLWRCHVAIRGRRLG